MRTAVTFGRAQLREIRQAAARGDSRLSIPFAPEDIAHECREQAFYPADWSPVCTDQLAVYNELLPEFRRYGGAELLGVSVDGAWCHLAFAKQRNYRFALLADFEPKGEVARAYDVYRKGEGVAERALFVIDGEGIVRWSYVSPIGINPGAEGILEALEEMQGRKT